MAASAAVRSIKAAFQQCWAASDSGRAFQSALEQRGYYLAKGDRRGVVAVNIQGEVYAVARWANVKTWDVTNRVSDLDELPSVSETQAYVAGLVREKLSGFIETATTAFAKGSMKRATGRIGFAKGCSAYGTGCRASAQCYECETGRKRSLVPNVMQLKSSS